MTWPFGERIHFDSMQDRNDSVPRFRKCGIWNVEWRRTRNVEFGIRNGVGEMWNVECGVENDR
jgi:hypothetical protein